MFIFRYWMKACKGHLPAYHPSSDDVTAVTLADNDTDGRCELDDGQRLAPGTVRRIACDGRNI